MAIPRLQLHRLTNQEMLSFNLPSQSIPDSRVIELGFYAMFYKPTSTFGHKLFFYVPQPLVVNKFK